LQIIFIRNIKIEVTKQYKKYPLYIPITMSDYINFSTDVINFSYIDYITRSYVPNLRLDSRSRINMGLFRQALTHPTACERQWNPQGLRRMEDPQGLRRMEDPQGLRRMEDPQGLRRMEDRNYERLEFLGDCIYHLILTEYLYKRYDEEKKGFLTRLRIKLERSDSMVELTMIMGLDSFIQYRDIYLNDNILEDVFEAFIGAFFLNFGMGPTRELIVNLLEMHKDFAVLNAYEDNYKDLLLQYFHKKKFGFPKYIEQRDERGHYISMVRDPFGRTLGMAKAKTKLNAEQLVSKKILIEAQILVDGMIDPNWIERIEALDGATGKKQKITDEKKKLSIYNPHNKLMKKEDIAGILGAYNIGYPRDVKSNYKIFHEAMTHKSYLKRKNLTDVDKKGAKDCVKLQSRDNERLTFLGDAVIHFIIGEYLFNNYPDKDEGFMTRLRCKLENAQALYELAKKVGLDEYVLLSQTIDLIYKNRNNVNIVGSALESFTGALYLELGLQVAKGFMLEVIRLELDVDEIADMETNYKEIISQLFIKKQWGLAKYDILDTSGPDHKKVFTMGLYKHGELIGKGKGNSKKVAEQICAKIGYGILRERGEVI
jgi:dsRNA-specific ribonuclease